MYEIPLKNQSKTWLLGKDWKKVYLMCYTPIRVMWQSRRAAQSTQSQNEKNRKQLSTSSTSPWTSVSRAYIYYLSTYIQSGWSRCWEKVIMGSSGAKPRGHNDDAISLSEIHTTPRLTASDEPRPLRNTRSSPSQQVHNKQTHTHRHGINLN